MKITSPLHCCEPAATVGRVDFLQRQVALWQSSRFQEVSVNGLFPGQALRPPFQPERSKRVLRLVYISAASKGPKPPPKPASRTAIIASIVVPLLLAASAVGAGKIMVARMAKEAMEEAEEWERQMNSRNLLTDGKSEEERIREKDDAAMSVCDRSTRNRPKREE